MSCSEGRPVEGRETCRKAAAPHHGFHDFYTFVAATASAYLITTTATMTTTTDFFGRRLEHSPQTLPTRQGFPTRPVPNILAAGSRLSRRKRMTTTLKCRISCKCVRLISGTGTCAKFSSYYCIALQLLRRQLLLLPPPPLLLPLRLLLTLVLRILLRPLLFLLLLLRLLPLLLLLPTTSSPSCSSIDTAATPAAAALLVLGIIHTHDTANAMPTIGIVISCK